MSSTIKSVRGMLDTLPPASAQWLDFEARCRGLFGRFGYQEIRTPILEDTALFSRGIGEATDIVEKEMYTFSDDKGRSYTLRPEMTASCVRAYIQHGVGKKQPITRWFYSGPMFRRERMQAGRYRQFFQIGVEALGAAEPTVEAEQIAMLCALYEQFGLEQANSIDHPQGQFCVSLNTVGTAEDRPRYREALLAHLGPHKADLCADCQRRLETNPLRILDCKVDGKSEVVLSSPSLLDFLGDDSRTHFDATQQALSDLGVTYVVDPRRVRGLDYYTGPVFELIAYSDEMGRSTTLVAGGRYDNLVESLGGPKTPAVGFSIGSERNIFYFLGDKLAQPDPVALYIATHGDGPRREALKLAHRVRKAGFVVEIEHRQVGMKAQFKRADKLGARHVLALGEQELADGKGKLRNMQGGDETPVALAELEATLRTLI